MSSSEVVRWLAGKAEELGVEIYPGFAAAEMLYARRGGAAGTVVGIATGDMGIGVFISVKRQKCLTHRPFCPACDMQHFS